MARGWFRKEKIALRKCEICTNLIPRGTQLHSKRISLSTYLKRRFCSNKCRGIYQKIEKKGVNNPHWKGGKPKCVNCENVVSNRLAVYCNDCRGLAIAGSKHPLWKGGLTDLQKLEKIAGRCKPDSCEVCGEKGKICFDHHHETGRFRGWICWRCNIVLGHIRDNPILLSRLKEYLLQFVAYHNIKQNHG